MAEVAARAGDDPAPSLADSDRLIAAERTGLRIGTVCRTVTILLFLAWILVFSPSISTRIVGVAILSTFAAAGVAFYFVIGSRFDRAWMKYVLYALDFLAIAGLFAFAPVSLGGDVPQIISFRAYGAYYLLLPLALSTLSLNPYLVAWCGLIGSASWWSAFLLVVRDMERTVTWTDLPAGADRETYLSVFLDPDFIGVGNRIEETAFLMVSAIVLAIAVHRARRVLRAQIKAEADRAFITKTFGEYVPEQVAAQIVADRASLAPQTRKATVMSVDIAGFTTLAEQASPEDVIGMLNAFLTDASEVVSSAGGVIVDFSGDGFIAAFNAPLSVPHHEARALTAAADLLAHVKDRRYGGHALNIRVGLATGALAAGSVGGGGRRTYTVYGDTVNLAARLQEMAKTKRLTVLMDAATADASGNNTVTKVAEADAVRGRASPVATYTFGAGT